MGHKKAKFCKDDARHAIVDGEVYPVLFTENIKDGWYEESIENSKTYPTLWGDGFRDDLKYKHAAVFADYIDSRYWEIKTLRAISRIKVFRSIECKVGVTLMHLEEEA